MASSSRHGHHVIDYVHIQHVGDEPRADPLDRVLARLQRLAGAALGNDRADGRLDRHDLHARLAGLEHFADAGDRAARAHARHEDIDLPRRCPARSPRPWSCDGSPDWPGS